MPHAAIYFYLIFIYSSECFPSILGEACHSESGPSLGLFWQICLAKLAYGVSSYHRLSFPSALHAEGLRVEWGLFVLFLNKGNVGKQSSISGATGEGQDPTFPLHDDRLFGCCSLGCGQRQFRQDNVALLKRSAMHQQKAC